MRQGPWTGRYPAAAAMVIFALVPYLALSAALEPITPIIAKDLHMSLQTMSLASGMANAGYAVGTVLAVLLAQHLPQRRMLVLYAALLVLGSVLAAGAPDAGFFIAGHVLQGLCTSLLLIAAVPPLVVSFSLSKLRWTAMILNVCIFGAVALGPLVGGIQAQANGWRPLFWIIAGIAAAALMLSLLTFQDAPPADRRATRNPLPVALAAAGCVSLFYGASELLTHPFVDVMTLVPLACGLALIVVLLVYQYRAKRPLLCIRPLGSTLPVSGIVVAMCAAASSISAVALAAVLLTDEFSPVHLGLLQFPEFIAALITAVVLGVVFRTRGLHYLVLGGMLSLIAGILVLLSHLPPTSLRYGDRLWTSRTRRRRLGGASAVHRRLLAAQQRPAARVRDHRAAARSCSIRGRAGVGTRGDDRRREPGGGHPDRAVDLLRDRECRHAVRGLPVCAGRSTPAGAGSGDMAERRGAGLVLAAAARPNP